MNVFSQFAALSESLSIIKYKYAQILLLQFQIIALSHNALKVF